MTERSEWQLPGFPVHPGRWLADELEAREITVEAFAEQVGRPLGELLSVTEGGALFDERLAQDVGQALGTGPDIWLNGTTLYLMTLERDYRRDSAPSSVAAAD